MTYNKKVWNSKELITKEALNNIEEGIDNLYNKMNNLATETYVQEEIIKAQLNNENGESIDLSGYLIKDNPEFTGTLSSIAGGIKIGLATEISKDNQCIAFGTEAKALNAWTFAFGPFVSSTGLDAFGEGFGTEASGDQSHAENYYTTARGDASHAEGEETVAAGRGSHVEGKSTVAGINTIYQHVQGKFNIIDTENRYAHIVGNGSGNLPDPDLNRSNAHTLDWNGNAWFAGDVFIKGTNQDDGQKLVTENVVNELRAEIEELRATIKELIKNNIGGPNIVGKSLGDAESLLSKYYMTIRDIKYAYSDEYEQGIVISQSIYGTEVDVVISKGKEI